MLDNEFSEAIDRVCQLVASRGKEYWWLKREVSQAFEKRGFHLLPRHFYSPVPDPNAIRTHDWSEERFPLSALRFDLAKTLDLCRELLSHAHELEALPEKQSSSGGFYWENPFFTGLDGLVLYGLIRHKRPARIVEIGSGFSTHLSLLALEANRTGRLTCIEPYPSPKLLELSDRIDLRKAPLQDVASEVFEGLTADDMLFIDSSHVTAFGSDVNFEVFNVLPKLPEGVFVQIHDIFFPFDYPRAFVEERRWYWTEQYLIYAFLLFNQSFEVTIPVHYLLQKQWDQVSGIIDGFSHPARMGASLWLRRTE